MALKMNESDRTRRHVGLRMEIQNRCFEFWDLLPEPKKSYTHFYQGIDSALNDWQLSDKEKKIRGNEI